MLDCVFLFGSVANAVVGGAVKHVFFCAFACSDIVNVRVDVQHCVLCVCETVHATHLVQLIFNTQKPLMENFFLDKRQ